ncbi:hypothetical protein [Nonomuraea sp. LPB2021202275-12-8]|uniref:hypothetical protein n=1 Tax=Nonomuraea sp. LPB2021202275-12-8 TaxID=3120159 RepID=UPI00300D0275
MKPGTAGRTWPATAAVMTGLVAVASVPGTVAAGVALRAGVRPRRLVPASVVMAIAAAGVFLAWPIGVTLACAALLMAANGLVVSALFAALPAVAGERAGWAAGALTRLGSLGTLLGPPLHTAVVDRAGWQASILVTALLAGAGLTCATTALRWAAKPEDAERG